ncbi:uncharacterized protein LACBIDRAFT_332864 [Laccaria bicolor S238N-H82]|uniref:Predicted protein n=1 Tax=Laccaria bicolor (strain S238N-H82 / ATCC MYA-4686) TaxID=486041 RepID=B0DU40_LACBS|nr:uncharacterized protein LACBIDRAFT_332864 [Laccaria bicolor S238N-H82]EDR01882.1 predicted protein [Laccaria bicolor S238N-H82]|eukprot:XP_001887492.1 predicted protein [Laccaria bicolor S238N-H82]
MFYSLSHNTKQQAARDPKGSSAMSSGACRTFLVESYMRETPERALYKLKQPALKPDISHVFHDSKFSEMGYSGSRICFLSKYSSDMFDDSKISHPGSALMTALLTEYSNCNDSQFSPSKLVLQLLKATK